ncbi:MAG: sugar ABC transporter substrate-binding protein [Boseongicola sp. SB0673_bin_14]|nr:sugar ABC transporter substrate-binding protein [Boseongicola sp. SB0673_bin_14]
MKSSASSVLAVAGVLAATALGSATIANVAFAEDAFVIGAAHQGLSRPINVSGQDGAREAAAELGVDLRETDAQDKFDKQLNDVQDLLAQGIDGLLVWPADSGGALEFIKLANEAGVPIIGVTTPIGVPDPNDPYRPADGLSGFVTWDDVGAGKIAAEAIMAHFEASSDPLEIAVLEGRSGYLSVDLRRRAFDETLTAAGVSYEVVSAQPGDWTQEKGEAVCQNFIAANPGLDAIYSMSDEMSVGCARAIASTGSDVSLFSVGGSAKGIALIAAGDMVATVCYKPKDNGYLAVHAMVEVLKGSPPMTDAAIVSDSPAVTRDNLDECQPQW